MLKWQTLCAGSSLKTQLLLPRAALGERADPLPPAVAGSPSAKCHVGRDERDSGSARLLLLVPPKLAARWVRTLGLSTRGCVDPPLSRPGGADRCAQLAARAPAPARAPAAPARASRWLIPTRLSSSSRVSFLSVRNFARLCVNTRVANPGFYIFFQFVDTNVSLLLFYYWLCVIFTEVTTYCYP